MQGPPHRECHLAVGGPGQRGNVVHPMVGQPRLCHSPHIGLPYMARGLLGQQHVCTKQRVDGQCVAALRLDVLPVTGQ